jgi:hypothetical protein
MDVAAALRAMRQGRTIRVARCAVVASSGFHFSQLVGAGMSSYRSSASLGLLAVGIAALVTSWGLGAWIHAAVLDPSPRSGPDWYSPMPVQRTGPQLVMVYVGSSRCPWSTADELPPAVEKLKLGLAATASDEGWTFKATGVSVDWRPADGIRHLDRFGYFDEIAAGYGWGGDATMANVWDSDLAARSTPQVIVYARALVVPDSAAPDQFIAFGKTELLALSGAQSILEASGDRLVLQRRVRAASISRGLVEPMVDETTPVPPTIIQEEKR